MISSGTGAVIGLAVVAGVAYYGILIFVVWKFYQMFANINNNIAAIHGDMAGMVRTGGLAAPGIYPAPKTKIQACPACGVTVMPTVEALCPACNAPMAQ